MWAQHAPEEPSFLNKHQRKHIRGRRQQGINYEAKAQRYINDVITKKVEENISDLFDLQYIQSPWLVYKLESDQNKITRYCQPDGIIVDVKKNHITIIEIKLQHTSDSWWQTRKLYEPVLKRIYPYHSFSVLEIVCWLDPSVSFPETFKYSKDIFDLEKNDFGVHIYRPRGNGKTNGKSKS